MGTVGELAGAPLGKGPLKRGIVAVLPAPARRAANGGVQRRVGGKPRDVALQARPLRAEVPRGVAHMLDGQVAGGDHLPDDPVA